ncbi:hypothetical protein [Ligilactobacillus acidipiscis]|uniref:Uncharacterized protein n=1 Tax=Ligilactobacillus acidipiscis TaxID=89059 RepID=A0A0R2KC01_9LACO|nr:hypothetical protein [Ligilactobacillus acidipiscis]KRN86994.1 hypothetical protein IV43_GL000111 [Ligilactobacillus acidipiscis]
MNNYQQLLADCQEIGDTARVDHFTEASTISQGLNISSDKFAQRFKQLPKIQRSELLQDPQHLKGVFAKCDGILVMNLNQTARDALNNYLDAEVY